MSHALKKLYKKLQQESINSHCAFEKRLAEKELADKTELLYKKMMDDLMNKQTALHKRREETSTKVNLIDDLLPLKRTKKKLGDKESKRKKMAVEWPFIIYQLKDCEIQDDCAVNAKA
eukprot:Awhi_evm1s12089